VREEIPLGRKNTGTHSLASELIEKRQQEHKKDHEAEYSMPYLFKRIGLMNRAGWKNYAIGAI